MRNKALRCTALLLAFLLASAQAPSTLPPVRRLPPNFVLDPTVIGLNTPVGWTAPTEASATTDADLAVNSPDNFSWILFTRINKLAPNQPVVNGKTLNNALWETWADDDLTYSNPKISAPPKWPAGGITVPAQRGVVFPDIQAPPQLKKLRVPAKRTTFDFQRRAPLSHLPQNQPQALILNNGAVEETRRNKQTFDFIVQNKLYYRQGLAAAFQSGKTLQFPRSSIEVKAHWKLIAEAEKPRYHWNYDASGKLYGMVALHIITKTIPNWTWATFEHVDNPQRCDVLGCFDAFGFTPAVIQPGGPYPEGQITPALNTLFQQAGLAPEFKNYRLRGTQNDFTDSTGRPTKLGNSKIEGSFINQSSCITCHASASFDAQGNPGQMRVEVGPPNPNWFWDINMTTPLYRQYDFVWGLMFIEDATP